ncbi:hypothetical protein DFH06DRAFT_1320024 [Mycena polygramma]|nr:hypothetical protein DFH06DRAFT_1320024 [Mycena polygramma]
MGNSNPAMNYEEAIDWVTPEVDKLASLYPAFASDEEQIDAWVSGNWETIKEAVRVYIACAPGFEDLGPVEMSFEPSGSLFGLCKHAGYVPVYWDPPTIQLDHEGSTYTVTTPRHVAALHALHDEATALAYLQKHHDSRTAVKPLVFLVHDGWRADVVGSWPADATKKNMVRYTLYAWNKHQEYDKQPDWVACRRYFSEHYDMKEVVDPEGRVLSSELSSDCLERMVSRL